MQIKTGYQKFYLFVEGRGRGFHVEGEGSTPRVDPRRKDRLNIKTSFAAVISFVFSP